MLSEWLDDAPFLDINRITFRVTSPTRFSLSTARSARKIEKTSELVDSIIDIRYLRRTRATQSLVWKFVALLRLRSTVFQRKSRERAFRRKQISKGQLSWDTWLKVLFDSYLSYSWLLFRIDVRNPLEIGATSFDCLIICWGKLIWQIDFVFCWTINSYYRFLTTLHGCLTLCLTKISIAYNGCILKIPSILADWESSTFFNQFILWTRYSGILFPGPSKYPFPFCLATRNIESLLGGDRN